MSASVLAIVEMDNYPHQVVARASWLAGLYDCELELLLSDPTASFLKDSFIVSTEVRDLAEDVREAQDRILADYAGTAKAQGIAVRTAVSQDRPVADAIVARALELEPRFVVKGTRYHSAAERATFAAADWQLMRSLEAPLWFVKSQDWSDAPLIVAAVDPTHGHDKPARLDRKIVEAGRSLASRCGGRLELLHSYQRMAEIGSKAMKTFKPLKLSVEALDAKIHDEHRAALDAFAAENDIDAGAVHQLPGRTEEILPAFAHGRGASLVVMGAIARSGIKRRVIGNTAERSLDHLACDVLIVYPD